MTNAIAKRKRGMFIVLEGCDRSGKSTQTMLLHQQIPDSVLLKYPNRSSNTGILINEYLKSSKLSNECIHLLFSANRWEQNDELISMLEQGKTVIADRYSFSGIAYSLAKNMDHEFCTKCERGLVKPDLILYLENDLEMASKRPGYGEEIYEKLDFQQRVDQQFKKVLKGFEHHIINGNDTIDNVHESIMEIVQAVDVTNRDLEKLDF
jgi:dTMP kinase